MWDPQSHTYPLPAIHILPLVPARTSPSDARRCLSPPTSAAIPLPAAAPAAFPPRCPVRGGGARRGRDGCILRLLHASHGRPPPPTPPKLSRAPFCQSRSSPRLPPNARGGPPSSSSRRTCSLPRARPAGASSSPEDERQGADRLPHLLCLVGPSCFVPVSLPFPPLLISRR
jgi:hypothetical protein